MRTPFLAHKKFAFHFPTSATLSVSTHQIGNRCRSIGSWLPLAIATLTVGTVGAAPEAMAQQSRCVSASASCGEVVYYDQPVSAANNSGFVNTQSGLGLNIRSGPGLNYPVIGGADNGVFLDLAGNPAFADGYRWQQVSSGGWVATEYLSGNAGNATNVGYDGNNCYRTTAYTPTNNNCYSTGVSYGNGGVNPSPIVTRPTAPVTNSPINRPISFGRGPYVVAVPGGNVNQLSQVRRIVPNAYLDRVRQGSFVNAGAYGDLDSARSLAYLLRSNNLDARVIYR
jgi:Bacterial SH3 domain